LLGTLLVCTPGVELGDLVSIWDGTSLRTSVGVALGFAPNKKEGETLGPNLGPVLKALVGALVGIVDKESLTTALGLRLGSML